MHGIHSPAVQIHSSALANRLNPKTAFLWPKARETWMCHSTTERYGFHTATTEKALCSGALQVEAASYQLPHVSLRPRLVDWRPEDLARAQRDLHLLASIPEGVDPHLDQARDHVHSSGVYLLLGGGGGGVPKLGVVVARPDVPLDHPEAPRRNPEGAQLLR